MVRGKPYISVKSATKKAAKAPNERQSRLVRGCVKLKAKMINTAALITTSSQRPYAGASGLISLLLQDVEAGSHHGRCERCHVCRAGTGGGADTAAPTETGERP